MAHELRFEIVVAGNPDGFDSGSVGGPGGL